jgi:hypothetical protein
MSAGVTWSGLDAMGALLRSLPEAVQAEAGKVVEQAARDHYADVLTRFPATGADGTGNLRRGNTLTQTGPLTWRTRNKAPHSHLYEKGYTHVSGRQVAGHDVWVTGAQAERQQMLDALQRVVERAATRTGVLSVR